MLVSPDYNLRYACMIFQRMGAKEKKHLIKKELALIHHVKCQLKPSWAASLDGTKDNK